MIRFCHQQHVLFVEQVYHGHMHCRTHGNFQSIDTAFTVVYLNMVVLDHGKHKSARRGFPHAGWSAW